jgi:hypothetical protein
MSTYKIIIRIKDTDKSAILGVAKKSLDQTEVGLKECPDRDHFSITLNSIPELFTFCGVLEHSQFVKNYTVSEGGKALPQSEFVWGVFSKWGNE